MKTIENPVDIALRNAVIYDTVRESLRTEFQAGRKTLTQKQAVSLGWVVLRHGGGGKCGFHIGRATLKQPNTVRALTVKTVLKYIAKIEGLI
jgi:hypothetical protein